MKRCAWHRFLLYLNVRSAIKGTWTKENGPKKPITPTIANIVGLYGDPPFMIPLAFGFCRGLKTIPMTERHPITAELNTRIALADRHVAAGKLSAAQANALLLPWYAAEAILATSDGICRDRRTRAADAASPTEVWAEIHRAMVQLVDRRNALPDTPENAARAATLDTRARALESCLHALDAIAQPQSLAA